MQAVSHQHRDSETVSPTSGPHTASPRLESEVEEPARVFRWPALKDAASFMKEEPGAIQVCDQIARVLLQVASRRIRSVLPSRSL